MPPISQRFAIPTNDDEFEEMCLQLLRRHWSRQGLEIFGKRGERQFGIDILDVGGETPIYAAQCKLKEEHKSLPPVEIQAEVDKAKQFTPTLGKYGILTTGKVSAQAQRKVREINQAHRAGGLFEVEVLTWERLCALLQQYPDVQEQFYGDLGIGRANRMEANLLVIRDGVESLTSRIDGDQVDSEINEAREYLVKREFQLATLLLNRIQAKKGDRLTQRQRFRVVSNRGAAELGLGRPHAAAKLFSEALLLQPNDEQGRINEVLAHLLVDDLSSSHAKASLLRSEYPASSRLAALWIITAPKEATVGILEAQINPILRSDAEVSVALARRALMERAFEIAFKYADSAAKTAPKWSQPQLVLAEVSLGRAINIHFGFQQQNGLRNSLLREAEEACTKALELARSERDEQTQKAALVHRVDVRLLLKENGGATTDAEDAERLDRDDPGVMLAVAQVRLSSGRAEDATAILSNAYDRHPHPHIAFIYGKALHDRGQEGDQDRALKVLLDISLKDLSSDLRSITVTQVIQFLVQKKDWTAAESYLRRTSEVLSPIDLKIARGYLAHCQGNPEQAGLHASEARSLLVADTTVRTREQLARLLMLIGRPADALPLWQDLFDLELVEFDPANLIDCAARLHRDDVVMQTCERMHTRGINDWHLIEFELQYLERYKINAAIKRLEAFLDQWPDHRLARLRLSLIGLLLNRSELVKAGIEDLPSIDELPLEYAVSAVRVMKFGGDPTRAVDYAYRFLRRNFNEIEAHRAFLLSMMPGSADLEILPTLDVAGLDAAVCYQEIPNGNPTWVVLEDTETPSGDFEEISLASPLAVELTGKSVGDKVVIGRGSIQDRVATILQILPKYVRRYQDSLGEMQVRFGAASSVESVQVGSPDDATGGDGLALILASVEKRAGIVDEIRDLYKRKHVSLHMYGAHFGTNAYLALLDLARDNGHEVKCNLGTSEERNQALQSLEAANAIVVDITALATLRLLDLTKVLSSTKYKFIVAERSWVTLREMLSEAQMFSGPSGTLAYEGGKHIMVEETAEEKKERNRRDEEFIDFIEEATELHSGDGLAALAPEKREKLEKLFGSYGAEAIILASHPDYVLWTDDLVLSQVSAHEFGVRRAWTQVVLGTLADAGLITSDEYSEASARLIGMEFIVTLFDAATMLAAFRLSEWSWEKGPADRILKIFSNPSTDLQRLLGIFAGFIEKLYREPIAPSTRCSAARAVLTALSGRPEALPRLKNLRDLSSRIFGLNAVGQEQFQDCFDHWVKLTGMPLIAPA